MSRYSRNLRLLPQERSTAQSTTRGERWRRFTWWSRSEWSWQFFDFWWGRWPWSWPKWINRSHPQMASSWSSSNFIYKNINWILIGFVPKMTIYQETIWCTQQWCNILFSPKCLFGFQFITFLLFTMTCISTNQVRKFFTWWWFVISSKLFCTSLLTSSRDKFHFYSYQVPYYIYLFSLFWEPIFTFIPILALISF